MTDRSIHELLCLLRRIGADLFVSGDDVRLQRPDGCHVPDHLRAELRSRKGELRAYLVAEWQWREAVTEIAGRWADAGRPTWIDDVALAEAVRKALQDGDGRAASEAVEAWRAAWLQALGVEEASER